jgi:hypothetical protein
MPYLSPVLTKQLVDPARQGTSLLLVVTSLKMQADAGSPVVTPVFELCPFE